MHIQTLCVYAVLACYAAFPFPFSFFALTCGHSLTYRISPEFPGNSLTM